MLQMDFISSTLIRYKNNKKTMHRDVNRFVLNIVWCFYLLEFPHDMYILIMRKDGCVS